MKTIANKLQAPKSSESRAAAHPIEAAARLASSDHRVVVVVTRFSGV